MSKFNFFIPIVAFLGFTLLFIYTTAQLEPIRQSSQWNLNLFAAILSILLFSISKEKSLFTEYFSADSLREIADKFAVGLVWGVIGVFAMNFFLRGVFALQELILVNLFGSVSPTFLASLSSYSSFFVIIVQPFSETLLLGTGILMIYSFLKHTRFPMPMLSALLLAAIMFSAFHFVSQGRLSYESSFSGYLNYIGDMKNYGMANYTGGMPLLFLGLFWGALFIVYKNFLECAGAHTSNNFLAMFLATGVAASVMAFVNIVGLFFVVLIGFAFWKGKFSKFQDFRLQELFK